MLLLFTVLRAPFGASFSKRWKADVVIIYGACTLLGFLSASIGKRMLLIFTVRAPFGASFNKHWKANVVAIYCVCALWGFLSTSIGEQISWLFAVCAPFGVSFSKHWNTYFLRIYRFSSGLIRGRLGLVWACLGSSGLALARLVRLGLSEFAWARLSSIGFV